MDHAVCISCFFLSVQAILTSSKNPQSPTLRRLRCPQPRQSSSRSLRPPPCRNHPPPSSRQGRLTSRAGSFERAGQWCTLHHRFGETAFTSVLVSPGFRRLRVTLAIEFYLLWTWISSLPSAMRLATSSQLRVTAPFWSQQCQD